MNAETRAALALARRGLSEKAIDRLLPSLDISSMDTDADVTRKVDALAEELPGVFDDSGHPSTGRPRLTSVDGGKSEGQATQQLERMRARSRTAADIERDRIMQDRYGVSSMKELGEKHLPELESDYERGQRLAREKYSHLRRPAYPRPDGAA